MESKVVFPSETYVFVYIFLAFMDGYVMQMVAFFFNNLSGTPVSYL